MAEIGEILRQYPADCRPTAVEPLGNAGGLSGAEFWRLFAPRGTLGLRCWPIERPTPERLAFIHAVLRHAAVRGLDFLPVPLTTTLGDSFVQHGGRLWELTPWLPGAADFEASPSDQKLRAAMVALAKFHVAVSDFPGTARVEPAPAITQRLALLRELLDGGIAKLVGAIDDPISPEFAPIARQLVEKLPQLVPVAIAHLEPLGHLPLPLKVCIRDVWSDNILFNEDAVSGLVDFGAVDVDTPATDVARLLGSLAGDDRVRWRLGLAAYAAVLRLTNDELQVVPALDIAGTVLGGCNWIRWIFVERREFYDKHRVLQRLRFLQKRFDQLPITWS